MGRAWIQSISTSLHRNEKPARSNERASSLQPAGLAGHFTIVTGLRIQASWVMFSIECWSMMPMEFQVNIA